MKRTKVICSALLLAIAWAAPSPLMAQILSLGKGKGLPKIAVVRDGLPALANPAYGEVMLSGNEALLEPAWLIGSLRDGETGQVLKWNNYLLPDAKPNVRLLTDTVFEGFVDSSACAKAEWLSTLKLSATDRTVAEVVVTRVSVTSVGPKQIDRARLFQELVQKLPANQQNRYSVVIAYIDIAITSTRFEHREVEGDVAGYGGRIGGEWYYKDKQKTTDHRLVAISAPLHFAMTAFAPHTMGEKGIPNEVGIADDRPCYELVSAAIKRGVLAPEKPGLLSVVSCPEAQSPIAIASSPNPQEAPITERQKAEAMFRIERERYEAAEKNVTAAKKSPVHSWEEEKQWNSGNNGTSPSPLPAYNPKTSKRSTLQQ